MDPDDEIPFAVLPRRIHHAVISPITEAEVTEFDRETVKRLPVFRREAHESEGTGFVVVFATVEGRRGRILEGKDAVPLVRSKLRQFTHPIDPQPQPPELGESGA